MTIATSDKDFISFILNTVIIKMSKNINVLALVKGDEKYIFLFNEKNRKKTLRQLGRFASNPDLSFTWYDAAVMSQKVRKLTSIEEAMESRYRAASSSD